jgi:hypothetical protein
MSKDRKSAKEDFIGRYLEKSRRLKNHNLPYGMQYFNLLAKVENDAEKAWLKKEKISKITNKLSGLKRLKKTIAKNK